MGIGVRTGRHGGEYTNAVRSNQTAVLFFPPIFTARPDPTRFLLTTFRHPARSLLSIRFHTYSSRSYREMKVHCLDFNLQCRCHQTLRRHVAHAHTYPLPLPRSLNGQTLHCLGLHEIPLVSTPPPTPPPRAPPLTPFFFGGGVQLDYNGVVLYQHSMCTYHRSNLDLYITYIHPRTQVQ